VERDESFKKIMPLVIQLMNKGGWDIVEQALASQDPAKALGVFLSELIMKVAMAAQEKGLNLDMKVFLRDNGIVEELLNLMERHFDMPSAFSDEIFAEVIDNIEKGLAAQQQPQGGAPPQQPGLEQQQPMPQQGAM
jgi:hypothetical protein